MQNFYLIYDKYNMEKVNDLAHKQFSRISVTYSRNKITKDSNLSQTNRKLKFDLLTFLQYDYLFNVSYKNIFRLPPYSETFSKKPKIFSDINTFLIYEVFVLILNVPVRMKCLIKWNKFETKSFHCELNIMIV